MARPLFGNVIIQPIIHEKTASGLVLPDANQNDPIQKGKVIAVGSGSLAFDGSPIEMEVRPDDTVLFKTMGAHKVKYDGEDCFVIEQRDILVVL